MTRALTYLLRLGMTFFISCQVFNVSGQPIWGRLANPGYENQPVKSTYFFTGNSKNNVQYYEYSAGQNLFMYTVWPVDNRHLEWSVDTANQAFAINDLIQSGINVVNMSIWGPRGTDNWADWAPMQTSTYSHDELFDIALDKNILIAPYLESSAASTTGSPDYDFSSHFPGDPMNYDTRILDFIEDIVDRYLVNPDNPRWPEKWAQVYDQDQDPRYMICIIHVASWQAGVTDQTFAEGFGRLADSVYMRTGVKVGFTLDILPHELPYGSQFRASPETTGPYLLTQKSILAIQCYIPEVFLAMEHEPFILNWKHQFSSRWIHTGIPFIQDISAGYDAHIVFPGSVIYGNNPEWRDGNGVIVQKLRSQGITFNTWNGYTEGYAGMPTNEYGSGTYLWVHDIFTNYLPNNSLHEIPGKIEAEDWSTMEGVQTNVAHDDHGGLYVGWMNEGDRIDYDVNITEGRYYVDLRIAKLASSPQGQGQIQLNGVPYLTFTVPGTGGWLNWMTIRETVSLPAGSYRMSLIINSGDWNINWMKFKTDSVEYYHPIPGRIEAEDYWDTFGAISERSTEPSSEVNLGYLESGDWMEYYVDIQQTGTYDIDFCVAQDAGIQNTRGEFYFDNTLMFDFLVPPTGGWQNWITLPRQANLTTGRHKLKILIAQGPFNLNWFEFELPTVSQEYIKSDDQFTIYPNPFSSSTQVILNLIEAGNIKLEIYNSAGVMIETLAERFLTSGEHRFTWLSGDKPEGIYFCLLKTPSSIKVVKGVKIN